MSYNTLASIWICFSLITFNYGNSFLFHLIFMPLWLTSDFLWTFYIFYWYLNSYSLFCIFVIPLSPFNPSLLLKIFIHWYANLMETSFEALVIIPIFYVSLLASLSIGSICSFKWNVSIPLILSTTFFPWPGALILISVIITYEDYNTVIKYISKAHIYLLEQPPVSYLTVYIPHTNIPE